MTASRVFIQISSDSQGLRLGDLKGFRALRARVLYFPLYLRLEESLSISEPEKNGWGCEQFPAGGMNNCSWGAPPEIVHGVRS